MVYYEMQLYHHGINGQRHGIRRFQNPDGSLTPLGRIRYGAKNKNNSGRKVINKQKIKKTNKSISEEYKSAKSMSDDELNKAINRMRLEDNYNDLVKKRIPADKYARIKKITSDLGEKAVRDIGGKAIEAIANNMAKKINSADKESKITDYNFKDISKVDDDTLKKGLSRLQTENQYKTALEFRNEKKRK